MYEINIEAKTNKQTSKLIADPVVGERTPSFFGQGQVYLRNRFTRWFVTNPEVVDNRIG